MSQNSTSTDFPGTSQPGGQTGTTSATDFPTGGSGSGTGVGTGTGSGTGTSTGTGTAAALVQDYGAKISEAASQAKDYARKNPGQAILISAAAGLLIGLIIRGRRS